jgi:signal transduction histidine kinase
MATVQRKNLSRLSLFSGSALAMAFSMLSVIVLLIWWQQLISRNLEAQYRFFAAETIGNDVTDALRRLIENQDAKLGAMLFQDKNSNSAVHDARSIIAERLKNRQKMVLYEQAFFIMLLLSGHIFFLYIYFRDRLRRRQTEETILLATHELRQPLQSLSLALETVAPKAKGQSLKAIESGLKDITRLGDHIRYLAGAFSPVERKAGMTRIENLQDFIETLILREFSAADRRRIVLRLEATGTIQLKLNTQLFSFLLRNLTENALKYATGTAEISGKLDAKYLSLFFENAGAAIKREDFERIGSIFYRPAAAGVQNTTGFGLGLYLCGRIARNAKGKLLFQNDEAGRTAAQLILRCH